MNKEQPRKQGRKDGIVEYVILEGSITAVQKQVEDRLDEGWLPLGGVSLSVFRSLRGEQEQVFAQAMVRTAVNKKSLAMTVPMAVMGEGKGGATTTINVPGVMAAGSMQPCPHCQKPLRVRHMHDGVNRCEHCGRDFTVEWDG